MSNETLARIETLIAEYRSFSDAQSDLDDNWRNGFGRWLQRENAADQTDEHEGVAQVETMIGMYLVLLNNLTKTRLNRLVNELPLASIMDYQFLVLLDSHGRQTKSDLISVNHMEMSSGIEVIRRLIRNGWIDEAPNPDDRRSKFVSISDDGKGVLRDLQRQVDEFYDSLCTDLDQHQKSGVLQTLELLVSRI